MTAGLYIYQFLLLVNYIAGLSEWDEEFEHQSFLDVDEKYHLYWTSHTDDCLIEFGLEVESAGYVAIGISLSGGMSGSDIMLGWVYDTDEDGDTYLYNYYALQRGTPQLFENQDGYELIDGWQQETNGTTKTFLRFYKDLFPSQYRENAVDVSIGTTRIIYAWNDNDGPDLTRHSTNERGPKSLNLLSGDTIPIEMPEDVEIFDILQPAVTIPSKDTTYWCTLLELPKYNNTQHILRIDPIIQSGNEGIVHHIVLFICPEEYVDLDWIGQGFDCDEWANMPTNSSHCRSGVNMYTWAVGGKNFYFPEHVGMEMSGSSPDAVQYVMLETHFDNPSEEGGLVDNSGLRLWYTPTLRAESAVVILIGDDYDQFIPPGIEFTLNYAYLTHECTNTMFPVEGVNVFANLHHQHLLGRGGKLRHIRNNTELKPIDINMAYDFDFQQYVPLAEEIKLYPGDEYILECTLDSSDRTEMAYGGESTRDEMCGSFMMVYPKPTLRRSVTKFLEGEKSQFFIDAEEQGYYNSETDLYNVSVDGALEFYNDFHSNAYRSILCMDGNRDAIEVDVIEVPSGYDEYEGDFYFGCVEDEDDDSSDGFEWDSWYVYTSAAVIGVLLVGLIIFFGVKCTNNKRGSTNMYNAVGDQSMAKDGATTNYI